MMRNARSLLISATLGVAIMLLIVSLLLPFLLRRAEPKDPSRYLEQFGGGILLYSEQHGGAMPRDANTLVNGGLLNPAAGSYIDNHVHYVGARFSYGSLHNLSIVSIGPRGEAGGLTSVLLKDGSVLAVPPEIINSEVEELHEVFELHQKDGRFFIERTTIASSQISID
jgi:hypothetical protein